jgi:hypothetical protein
MRDRRKRKVSRGLRLLPLVFPAAATVWFLLQSPERRRRVIERVPQGAGERALDAGLGFCLLIGLAWIVLPVTYWSHRWSRRALRWCVDRPVGSRLALLPVALVVGSVSALTGIVFAANALAIVAVFLLTLLMGVWVFQPDFLGGPGALWAGLGLG